MKKLISIDLRADLGFLKKPDINEGIYLTYNMLHKPVLLGILGAVIGLEGYRQKGQLPEYYLALKDMRIGIQPLYAQKGYFFKSVIQYCNGVGYASQEEGGNLIIREQILIRPAFRCYLELDLSNALHQKILDSLKQSEAEYLPYLGKNEFSLWWENFKVHEYAPFQFDRDFVIMTLFMKAEQIMREMVRLPTISFLASGGEGNFMCFEELPIGFDERLLQYEKRQFVFTNFTFGRQSRIEGLYQLRGQDGLVQLF